ncbi:MAG: DNA methyltransferase [Verrucomicrobia bacterium]|nr:DNA methyltransferase [Verrucomicrobiota bacterium]
MSQPTYLPHPAACIFPMLPAKEIEALADDIKARGQLYPIILYEDQVLDGRNRLRACELAGVAPHFRRIDLDKKGISPIEFVVSANVRRRQLRPGQRALAAAEALPQWVAQSRIISNANLRRGRRRADPANVPARGRSSDAELGKLFGISARYIRLAAQLRRQEPRLADKVFEGECTLHRAVRAMRARQRRHLEQQERTKIRNCPVQIELVAGDALDLCGELRRDYQLILTDPPYDCEGLDLWTGLARIAHERLAPGGFVAALSGLHYFDEVMGRLSQPKFGLCYFWTLCLAFNGAHGRRHGQCIASGWRPLVVFYKPPLRRPPRLIVDRFAVTAPALPDHPMEQCPETFAPIIEDLSRAGDWLLDPFAGSGAVLEAARNLGRNAIGCEKDLDAAGMIMRRLNLKSLTLVDVPNRRGRVSRGVAAEAGSRSKSVAIRKRGRGLFLPRGQETNHSVVISAAPAELELA